ncbi:hypothetical protein ACPOL_4754 [Acidisarcina polymorpha]|uniref:Uncharacterized protein n=1 Tax=Acidisarcina polymorpha TaxID=2211140 RepID=A0A2Z5G4E7_9BACT|nr:hypothetical protein ACPOL_4754 [Acidisarcina polymorpha]
MLSVVILVGILLGAVVFIFYSAGNGRLIDQHPQSIVPSK